MDGLEFSKNQPSWGFLFLRLESDDLNFVKYFLFVHLKFRVLFVVAIFIRYIKSTYYESNVST